MRIKLFDESIEKFISSLNKPTIAKVLRIIDLLEIFDYRLGLPHCKKVANNLFELRIRGKQEIRIFYTFFKNEIVLLHSFIKKSQKIPQKELQIASKRLKRLTNI